MNRAETWGILIIGRNFKNFFGLKTFGSFVISSAALTQNQGKTAKQ